MKEWPALPLPAWRETKETLHLWLQVAGKIRLALAPPVNHWWHVTLSVSARGLATPPMPYGDRLLELEFDFLSHRLHLRASTGEGRSLALAPRTVADFHAEVRAALEDLRMPVAIRTLPCEVEGAIPFEEDTLHRAYDPARAQDFWRVLVHSHRVLTAFRSPFLGKCSPVHFFWGGMDLAVTRFSGRRAPDHPGAPFLPLRVAREAYSHEVASCGFWPGGGVLPEPAFYAYAYPEPEGYRDLAVEPEGAYYHPDLREFILPYEAVRRSGDPEGLLLRFLESTYAGAADLAGWDRAALEREPALVRA